VSGVGHPDTTLNRFIHQTGQHPKMAGKKRCSFCGKSRNIILGLGDGCTCRTCLETLGLLARKLGLLVDELKTLRQTSKEAIRETARVARRRVKKPPHVGDRVETLTKLVQRSVQQQGRVYADSLAWRHGFTRSEVMKAIERYGREYGWVVEKTPRHIIVGMPGPREDHRLHEEISREEPANASETPKPRASKKKPIYVEGDRVEALANLIHRTLKKRRRLYAVSFAWRLGFKRSELRSAIERYGETYGWVAEKAPNNHIILRLPK
jgi:translation initiation factor 2 beta subunit (eIF-2beta)/eIF-5